eukprot:jgi/Ulvmu1/10534/UM064_0072.1
MSVSILRSYRELVRLLLRLPSNERADGLQQARKAMREHETATDEQVADLHRILVSKICFLRMKVPKYHRDASAVGSGHYVVRDGKVVSGRADHSTASAIGSGLTQQEAWQRHRQLMKRQYFGQEPPQYSEIL